jgi:hypothetical protein
MKWKRAGSSTSFGEKVNWLHSPTQSDRPANAGITSHAFLLPPLSAAILYRLTPRVISTPWNNNTETKGSFAICNVFHRGEILDPSRSLGMTTTGLRRLDTVSWEKEFIRELKPFAVL